MIEIIYNESDRTHQVMCNTKHIAKIEPRKEGHFIYKQRKEQRVAKSVEQAIVNILNREMGLIK